MAPLLNNHFKFRQFFSVIERMKIIIKRISVKTFVIWHSIMSVITGILASIVYAVIVSFYYSGEELRHMLIGYIVGLPVLYFFLGLITALFCSILYNSLSSFLAIKFQVEKEDSIESMPPAPPTFEN